VKESDHLIFGWGFCSDLVIVIRWRLSIVCDNRWLPFFLSERHDVQSRKVWVLAFEMKEKEGTQYMLRKYLILSASTSTKTQSNLEDPSSKL
jgi:hypothetical protein